MDDKTPTFETIPAAYTYLRQNPACRLVFVNPSTMITRSEDGSVIEAAAVRTRSPPD